MKASKSKASEGPLCSPSDQRAAQRLERLVLLQELQRRRTTSLAEP